MVLGGVAVGLAIAFIPAEWRDWRQPAPIEEKAAEAPAPDPYSEARRSREILEAQEGAPEPAAARGIGSDAVERVGADAVIDVIDGDTFRYAGERIRIADIDTPELRGQCAHEKRLAAQASDRMAELLAAGPFELHRMGRDTDRYGRKLRVVIRGGQSLGDQLVAEGLARTWSGRREPWC